MTQITPEMIELILDQSFPNFQYRQHQRESILKALEAILIRNKRYVVLNLPTGCFSGDTRVRLLNGTTKTMKELADEKAKDFYVLACDPETQEIKAVKATSCWKTKTTNDLVIVTLDDNSKYTCTPDHLFMLRDGSWKEAQDLKENDSLMPLYIGNRYRMWELGFLKNRETKATINDQRMRIYNPCDNSVSYLYTHIIHNQLKQVKLKNYHIHHIDFNHLNDSPDNLTYIHKSNHLRLHSEQSLIVPELKEKRIKGLMECVNNVEHQRYAVLCAWYDEFGNKNQNLVEVAIKNITKNNQSEAGRKRSNVASAYMRYLQKFKLENSKEYKELNSAKRGIGSLNGYLSRYRQNPDKFSDRIDKLEKLKVEKLEKIKQLEEKVPLLLKKPIPFNEFKSQYLKELGIDSVQDIKLKNHKVKSVEKYVGSAIDVYDIEVPELHNFAIEDGTGSGIFVHNSGKSHIGHKIAHVYNKIRDSQTLFLTKTISLQNQYVEDFSDMVLLKGATNYDCSVDYQVPFLPKDKVHPTCKYHRSASLCEYSKAKSKYDNSKLKLLNYAFYLTGIDTYQVDGLVVADEAHNLEESILNMLGLELDLQKLRELCLSKTNFDLQERFLTPLSMIKTLDHTTISTLVNFIEKCIANINVQIAELEKAMEKYEGQKLINLLESKVNPLMKAVNDLNYYGFRLSIMQCEPLSNFSIAYEEKDKTIPPYFAIKPVFVPVIVRQFLFGEPEHFVFMSATAERIKDSLNLPDEDTEIITAPYIFDLTNRPMYAFNTMPKLNIETFDKVFPQYCGVTDSIISQYDNKTNIIIHSVSYKNAELLMQNSEHKDRMFIPTAEQVRNLKDFITEGMIVVSPSITEGVDLGNGLARVQIFVKCPYPYLGDLWVKKKMELDNGWYAYATMLNILQGSGRGVRSATDKADTYILDPSFKRLYYQNDKLNYLPTWLDETIQWIG